MVVLTKWSIGCFLILCSLICSSAELTAHADRTILTLDETLVLTVKTSSQSDELPDLQKIQLWFDILDQSTSVRRAITNGYETRESTWRFILAPKAVGTYTIPSLTLGQLSSQPISVTVLAPEKTKGLNELFIESNIDTSVHYVNTAIILSVKVFHQRPIENATLSKLSIDNAYIEIMNKPLRYQIKREGVTYNVIEQRYAIIPETSGTMIVPRQTLTASAYEKSSVLSGWFSSNPSRRQIRRLSKPIIVEVKPRPTSVAIDEWFPASGLKVTEKLSPSLEDIKLGDSVTRTITIEASNQVSSYLPKLDFSNHDGISIYPDKPQLTTVFDSGGLVARAVYKIAYIPTQEGELSLPKLEIHWFDTLDHQLKTAILPEHPFLIAPLKPESSAAILQPFADRRDSAKSSYLPAAYKVSQPNGYWWSITALFAVLWLLTLTLLLRKKHYHNHMNVAEERSELGLSLSRIKSSLKNACANNRPLEAKQALIQWFDSVIENKTIVTLRQCREATHQEALQDEIENLESTLYAPHAQEWSGKGLWQAFLMNRKTRQQPTKQMPSSIDSLYPLSFKQRPRSKQNRSEAA